MNTQGSRNQVSLRLSQTKRVRSSRPSGKVNLKPNSTMMCNKKRHSYKEKKVSLKPVYAVKLGKVKRIMSNFRSKDSDKLCTQAL